MATETNLDSAGKALADFASGPVASAADSIGQTMDRTFGAMENAIARFVVSGKASIADFVASVVSSLDRLAVKDYLLAPLEGVVSSVVQSIMPVGGARAEGGPVDAGKSYLVGENGPETFVPSESGTIVPNARPSIVLNVQARDAQTFLKSETQLAAMLARALARGQRNL
ncbi:phage tail tape measure C-terminal domain-containing protein [Rhizomicrobium electricum]|uniref:Bacteriophage tail tape measure C-terminal domain-containing protein n=1 Tax=Rhizomicrobium electricum TaxID=480070 RepID=A0ABN1EHQ2_9PROT|nr:phage tail tape measure C-terminal domain-containing protein [Rhizomicrobium electricum]NIJ48436.1 phage-related minor tail protein [Rhizomicrobium electricum]